MKKIIYLACIFLPALLISGTYVVPAEYDNLRESSKSPDYGVITNASTMSTNTYTMGGLGGLKYRCLPPIPKISCRGSNAIIIPALSDIGLKDNATGETVPVFSYDLRLEDDVAGNTWRLCAAAYGGFTADTSTLSSSTVAGVTTIKYTYVPNNQEKFYHFFTNANTKAAPPAPSLPYSIGHANSFIAISWRQTCR